MIKRNLLSLRPAFVALATFCLLITAQQVCSQTRGDSIQPEISRPYTPPHLNPSSWLQQSENTLILMESHLMTAMDTSFMEQDFDRLMKDFELTRNDFASNGSNMRIRTLDDVKAKLEQQLKQLEKWRNGVRKINSGLAEDFQQLEELQRDSARILLRTDSSLLSIYMDESKSL